MSSQTRASLAVLLTAILWGTSGTAQQLGTRISPLLAGELRLVIGSIVLVPVAIRKRHKAPKDAAAQSIDIKPIIAAGVAACLFQFGFFATVDTLGVGVGTLLVLGSAPAATALIGFVVARQRVTKYWIVGTLIAVVGLVPLVLTPGDDATPSITGVLLAVVCGCCYAVYTTGAQRSMNNGTPPTTTIAGSIGFAATLGLPALVFVDIDDALTYQGAATVVWLGIVCTALAYLLFVPALDHLDARSAASLGLAEPVTAVVLALTVLGEKITIAQALGIALVLAGLTIVSAFDKPTITTTIQPTTETQAFSRATSGSDTVASNGIRDRAHSRRFQ